MLIVQGYMMTLLMFSGYAAANYTLNYYLEGDK